MVGCLVGSLVGKGVGAEGKGVAVAGLVGGLVGGLFGREGGGCRGAGGKEAHEVQSAWTWTLKSNCLDLDLKSRTLVGL